MVSVQDGVFFQKRERLNDSEALGKAVSTVLENLNANKNMFRRSQEMRGDHDGVLPVRLCGRKP
jgi:hypothetical protein